MLLILSGNLSKAPYVSFYEDLGSIRVIAWNRTGHNSKAEFVFEYPFSENFSNVWATLYTYFKYSLFVRNILRETNEQRIVIFNVANFLFLSLFCHRELKKRRVVFDLRDFSTAFRYYKFLVKILCKSLKTLNVYSSPAFVREMNDRNGVLVHNIQGVGFIQNDFRPLRIMSTIGSIRDVNENIEVISMAAELGFMNRIHGDGPALIKLQEHFKQNTIDIEFTGFFEERQKPELVHNADIINNYNKSDFNGSKLLSNRFYISIMSATPQVVNKNTYQGRLAIHYGVGFGIDNFKRFRENWSLEFWNEYKINCESLLKEILYQNEKAKIVINEHFN